MLRRRAYKFRLKPTKEMEHKFTCLSGQSRFVWNKALAWNKDRLNRKLGMIFYNEMAFWLTIWKSSEEYSFLKESHSQSLQQSLKDLDKAFKDAFDKKQPGKRFPRFKKREDNQSFRYPQGFKLDNRRIFLPKLGWVNFFKSQEIAGTAKNVTVSQRAGKWYVSIQVEEETAIKASSLSSEIGIDMGVACFATLSNGDQIGSLHSFKKGCERLKKEQVRLARKKKGSNSWKQQVLKVGKVHHKIGEERKDFLHKASSELSKNHAILYLEDLNVKGMTKSAKGTIEIPGRSVSAKRGLNRSILDQGWGEFRRQLSYKMAWNGGSVKLVSPRHTSQRCYKCLHVHADNRKSQAVFECIACGHADHADVNAAKNILAVGQTVLASPASLTRGRQEESLRNRKKISA
jgi:putative transposase